jgi:hypothetical protein
MNIFQAHWDSTVRKTLNLTLFIGLLALAATATAQPAADTAIKATQVYGKVSEVNSSSGQLLVKTAAGNVVAVNVSEKTTYERMPPGETDRTKAVTTSFTEITVGDGVVARGFVAADRKSVPAQQIIVVSQSDIARKQEKERAEWRRRGVSGIVSSVNPSTQEITVASRSMMGQPQTVIIPISTKVSLRRYPPDTVPKYSEAKPSKFEEVKVGDQLRALGDKTPDGTHLSAEEVIFGTFKIAGGTVTEINAATNQIKITDLQTKKPLTIVFKPESIIRRLPQGAAMFGGGAGGPGGPGTQAPGQARPQGGPGQTAPGGPGQTAPGGPGQTAPGGPGQTAPGGPQGSRPGGVGSMADLLERLPTISINDLKVGDVVLMSSLPGADPTQLTAIQLVSGIEPLLAMMSARQQQGGAARPQVDLNGSFGGMFGGVGVP